MKILGIELENLNSLRGKHIVRFDEPPLSTAGLFAITGPTGAGKSTLLDAITLALFGCASRYGSAPNPEGMMSRHTGRCFAQVEFEIPMGRYTATWELWRARNQPDGRIQAPKRCIYQEGVEEPLAATITESKELIEKLLGLDYDRFLRSVMLAQGEFARFLKAKSNERAELLESLTATTIYSQLGQLCYRTAKEREQAIQARLEAANSIEILSDEARAEHQQALEAAQQEQTKARARQATLDGRVGLGDDLVKAERQLEELTEREGRLAEERAEAQEDLQRLETHAGTRPFAPALQALASQSQRLKEARGALQQAAAQQQTHAQAWRMTLLAARDYAHRCHQQATEAVKALGSEQSQATRELADCELWLREHAVDARMEEEASSLASAIAQVASARQTALEAAQAVSNAQKLVPAAEQAEQQAGEAAKGSETAMQKAEQVVTEARERLAAMAAEGDEDQVQEAGEAKRLIHDLLEKLVGCLEEQAERSARIKKADEELGTLRKGAEVLRGKQQAAAKAVEDAETTLARRRDHYQKTLQIEGLEEKRKSLAEGEACPLCGSLEHPFIEHGTGGISAADLRKEVKEAEEAVAQARKAQQGVEQELTRLATRQSALRERREEAEADLKSCQNTAAELRGKLKLEATDTIDAKARLAAVAGELKELRERFSRLRALGKTLREAEKEQRAAQDAHRKQESAAREAAQALQACKQQVAAKTAEKERREAQVAALIAPLRESLQPFGLPVPAAGEETKTQALLSRRDKAYRARCQKQRELTATLARLAERLKEAEAKAAERAERVAALDRQSAAASADAQTIDSAAVAALASTWDSVAEAEGALQEQRQNLAVARETHQQREEDATTARDALEEQRQGLTERLAESPFADIEALQAGCLTDEEVQRIETLRQQLRSRADALAGERKSLTKAMAELREKDAPTGEALAELKEERAQLAQEIEGRAERIGSVRERLDVDAKNRQKREQELADIAKERQEMELWQQLSGLIGSAEGQVFREFAQGISLDLLIRHANRHLGRLNPRYQVRRCHGEKLELEIEDRYQGGATRAMESLSGGESFLVSLALALGLADLAGRNVRIESLFIDEGFGSLDSRTVDEAIAALDSLRQDSKTIGVISHVELLKERIATQIQVVPAASGSSSTLDIVSR